MPYDPPPELAALSLAELAEQIAARKLPPVSEWAPTEEADSEMRIASDGTWYHQGSPITRPAMVRAFASLLRREADGRFYLVLPYQKQSIEVEDAPFIATDVSCKDDALAFRLNTNELVIAGPDHPLRAAGDAETPALYVMARNGCEARLNRSTYAQLAEIALAKGDDWIVESLGARFRLVPA